MVPLERYQIVERIDLVDLGRVDQTHVDISDPSSLCGLIEQAVLAMQDGPLQGAFADIVVQGGSRLWLSLPQRRLNQKETFKIIEFSTERKRTQIPSAGKCQIYWKGALHGAHSFVSVGDPNRLIRPGSLSTR